MVSPFYVGYAPDPKKEGPGVAPGYFPGMPSPRPPKPGKPVLPTEMDFDALSGFVDGFGRDVSQFVPDGHFVPPFFRRLLEDDVKRNLTLTISAKKPTYNVQEALQFGDLDEAKGVALKLSLDPEDWQKNGVLGQSWKTLTSWYGATFNQGDLEDIAGRRYIWQPLVSGHSAPDKQGNRKSGGFGGWPSTVSDPLIGAAFHGYDFRRGRLNIIQNPANGRAYTPFQLHDWGVIKEEAGKEGFDDKGRPVFKADVDVYKEVSHDFLKYIDDVEDFTKRNGNYVGLAQAAVGATLEELKQNRGVGGIRVISQTQVVATKTSLEQTLQELHNLTPAQTAALAANPADKLKFDQAVNALKLALDNASDADQAYINGGQGLLSFKKITSARKAASDISTITTAANIATPRLQASLNLVSTQSAAVVTEFNTRYNIFAGTQFNYVADYFEGRAEVAATMGGIRSSITAAKKDLAKIFLDEATPQPVEVNKALQNFYKPATGGGGGGAPFVPASGLIVEARTSINAARGKMTAAQIAVFDRQIADYEKFLNGLEKLVTDYQTAPGAPGLPANFQVGRLINELDLKAQALVRHGPRKGIEHKFLDSLVEDIMDPDFKDGGQGGVPQGMGGFFKVMRAQDPAAFLAVDNMQRVLKIANRHYEYNELLNVLSQVEGGKLFETYLWSQEIRSRIMAYTPGALFGEALKRTHYFGLYYDPEYENKNILWVIPSGKIFKKVGQSFGLISDNKFKVILAGIEIGVKGGKHLEGALLLGAALRAGGLQNASDLLRVLNVTDTTEHLLTGLLTAKNKAQHANDLKKLREQIQNFRNWLYTSGVGARLGLVFVQGRNNNMFIHTARSMPAIARLKGFLDHLWKRQKQSYFIDITVEKAALLRKIASRAGELQALIFEKLGIAKAFSFYYQAKEAFAQFFATLTTEGITWALGLISGGGGKLLSPLINKILWPILKWIGTKLWDYVGKFIAELAKGDLSGFLKSLDKNFRNSMKTAIYLSLIPIGCMGVVMFFMGVLISAISPVNSSRTSFTGGGGFVSGGSLPSCSDPGEMPPENFVATPIAKKGFGIVNSLSRGVWCYWNKGYPGLWSSACTISGCPDYPGPNDIFWCTWLVVKAYEGSSFPVPAGELLSAGKMRDYFMNQRGHGFIQAGNRILGKVGPGDAVFSFTGNSGSGYHVAMVYDFRLDSQGNGYLISIDSNGADKYHTFSVVNGVVQNLPGFKHAGIGLQ